MSEITVGYERKFSDGNYGSEGMSVSWSVVYEDETDLAADPDVIGARCSHITDALRSSVLAELAKSQAYNVARAAERELNPPAPAGRVVVTRDGETELEDLPY